MTVDQVPLYRYPGTKPFEAEEYGLFKGRNEDIKNLSELISLQNLIVLFARSGLGKTSLLNAGLVNSFKTEPGIVPVFIRFGAYHDKTVITPLNKLYQIVSSAQQTDPSNFIYEKLIPQEDISVHHLWYLFKSFRIANAGIKKFVLIFDQFEELFTYPEAVIDLFKKELSELLYVSVPQQLRNLLKDKLLLNAGYLTDYERELLFDPLNIKILFSIRSDKLSLLNKLTDYFPSVLKLCYELKPLNKQQAQQAIEEPAKLNDKNYISPPFTFTSEALSVLLHSLTEVKNKGGGKDTEHRQEIETFQLQIVCKHAENLVLEKGLQQITAADLGNIKEIFENHYRNIIDKLLPEKRLPARKLIEEKLIIEGMRVSMPIPFILKDQDMTKELLDELINTHILRPEQNNTLEISHDTLLEPILKYYEERKKQEALDAELLEKEAQIRKIKETQEKALMEQQQQQEMAAQKLKTRRNRLIISIVSAALVLTVILAARLNNLRVETVQAYHEANRSARMASQAVVEARKSARIAIQQRQIADSNTIIAEQQRRIADSSAGIADIEKLRANKITKQAIQARAEAILQSKRADSNAAIANEKAEEARQAQQEIAAVEEAFRLTVLAYDRINTDPTLALRLQEAAIAKHPDSIILKVANQIYDLHGFYKILNNSVRGSGNKVFSPDGKTIFTNKGLYTLEGKPLWEFTGNTRSISAAAFSRDRSSIVFGSNNNIVRVISSASGALIKECVIPLYSRSGAGIIRSVAFSPNGKKVFASFIGNGPSCIWNINDTIKWTIEPNATGSRVSTGVFLNDSCLLINNMNGKTSVWDIYHHKVLIEFAESMPNTKFMMPSSDGEKFLTNQGLFKNDGTLVWKFDASEGNVCTAAFSCDRANRYIVTGDCYNHTARLWDNSGNVLLRFNGHNAAVNAVSFSNDGRSVLTNSSDETIRSWHIYSRGIPLKQFKIKQEEPVTSMALSSNRQSMVTCTGNRTARLWDMEGNLKKEFKLLKDSINAVAFSSEGSEIVTGCSDGKIRMWNMEGALVKEFTASKDGSAVVSVDFSKEKNSIVAGSVNGMVTLLNIDGKMLREVEVGKDGTQLSKVIINSTSFSITGDSILIGYVYQHSHRGIVEAVDLYSEAGLQKGFGSGSLTAFSRDGKKSIMVSRNGIASENNKGVVISSTLMDGTGLICVSYSFDATKYITCSYDGTVTTWESAMTLEEFLKSDLFEQLTDDQKKEFGIK